MGKTVIRASDGPGFLVNRCNRPFGLEALRLLQERIADVETIDRIVPHGGRLSHGPVRADGPRGRRHGFEISKSFYEQSFGEPRWRPSPIPARYVAAGLHGRKTGRGYYDYSGEGADGAPAPPAGPRSASGAGAGDGEGVVVIAGAGVLAEELRTAAAQAGYEVRSPHDPTGGVLPALIVECDRAPAGAGRERGSGGARRAPPPCADAGGRAPACCAQAGSLGALDPAGSAVGFHVLAAAGAGEAGRADAQRQLLAAWRQRARSASSPRSASTSRGSATRRGSCSGGSSAR